VTAPSTASRPLPSLPRSRRLVGVDAARGLALLGMMAAHLLPREAAAFPLVDGRSSATFALLAGAGLALADGGHLGPRTPFGRMVARTAVRAGVILVVGLVLATLQPPVAVILQYYALSFLLIAPLLRLPAAVLGGVGVAWLAVVPVASHALRETYLLSGPGSQVGIERLLVEPAGSVQDLLLTGYYPVLTWFGYLLLGAAVGRLDLTRRAVAVVLAGAGMVLAVGSSLVSQLLLGTAEAEQALAAGDPLTGRGPDGPFYGTTPTSSWWWLAVDTPHSGTPPDLLGTAGAALVVVGLCLLVARTAGGWALLPFAAAGSMTLSLYTFHVLAVTAGVPGLDPSTDWFLHASAAVLLATIWRLRFTRGPLEAGTAVLVDAVAGPSTPRQPPEGPFPQQPGAPSRRQPRASGQVPEGPSR
jgi:uncharacterized membrane protein